MTAGAGRKSEAEKCLHLAGRLRAHLAALRSLGLGGEEERLLLEALSHVELAKASLSEIAAGIEAGPDAARERGAMAPGGMRP